jgi:hypothetical protein
MRKLLLFACLAGLAIAPGTALGQISVGGQVVLSEDFDFGVGGRLTWQGTPVGTPVAVIGSFDTYFPKTDPGVSIDYWEFNVNLAYVAAMTPELSGYVGGGLNYADISISGVPGGNRSGAEIGFNVMGGLRYRKDIFVPFAEGKFTFEGGEQWVLTLGVDIIVGSLD